MGEYADLQIEQDEKDYARQYLRDLSVSRQGVVKVLVKRVKCLTCGKTVKEVGLAQHVRDAHEQPKHPK